MVVVERSDGSEFSGYAKFASDEDGTRVAEQGSRSIAAELLASKLARALSVSVPDVEAVDLGDSLPIKLRSGKNAAPGVAVVSVAVESAVDVAGPEGVADVPKIDLARIAVFHAFIEAGDRNHNMIRAGGRAYSIDHAT